MVENEGHKINWTKTIVAIAQKKVCQVSVGSLSRPLLGNNSI